MPRERITVDAPFRKMTLDDLAMAKRHVAEAKMSVQRQRKLVIDLNEKGHFGLAGEAARLLLTFISTQAAHTAHRDRLLKELAKGTHRAGRTEPADS